MITAFTPNLTQTTLRIFDPNVNVEPTVSSKKKKSSSYAPIVDLNTLANTRIVDIPTAISDWISPSKKPSDLTNTMAPDDTFDPPLVMNGLGYLLDGITNTLVSQSVTTGNPETEIVFTVYTETDLAHFTLYLNLQGNDVNYSGSDTYITYTTDGTVSRD